MAQPTTFITIVTGLPRSGTSMIMQMLGAGGVPLFADDVRQPDDNNPRGYFEHAAVKRLQSDATFLRHATGKAIKVIVQLLPYLPDSYLYKVIMIERDVREVVASQAIMLSRLGTTGTHLSADALAEVYARQVDCAKSYLEQRRLPTLYLSYASMVAYPKGYAQEIVSFLDLPLSVERMILAVNPELHRVRVEKAQTSVE